MKLNKIQEYRLGYVISIVIFAMIWIISTLMALSTNSFLHFIMIYSLLIFLFIGGIFWYVERSFEMIFEEVENGRENNNRWNV